MSGRARIVLKSVVWSVALSPLLLLLYRFLTNGLGANPISYATNLLGDTTLRLLLASLALTPLRIVFGISWQMSLRRLLGLFAFFYVCLHFTVWIAVDHFFEWGELIPDIVKRWTVGPQAPLSVGFSRQEYWSGLPFPLPGDLPDSGKELLSPA